MNFSLPEVRSGQPVRADDYNRLIRHVKANTISGSVGILMERSPSGVVLRAPRSQSPASQAPSEFLFINKLSLYYNPTSEAYEVWIYAPSGVPSLFYWGESGSTGPVASGAVEWRTPAYVDSSLTRDGDWVNTGIGQVSSIYAYIDSGAVKFSADVPVDGESQDYTTPVTPYVWIGKMDWTANKMVNIIVGAVGLSSGVKHDATLEDNG